MTESTVPTDTLGEVTDLVVSILGIEDRADTLSASTGLFGEMPELDSLMVVELATALEDRFDIVVEDEDISGETFETLGSLAVFVEGKRG